MSHTDYASLINTIIIKKILHTYLRKKICYAVSHGWLWGIFVIIASSSSVKFGSLGRNAALLFIVPSGLMRMKRGMPVMPQSLLVNFLPTDLAGELLAELDAYRCTKTAPALVGSQHLGYEQVL